MGLATALVLKTFKMENIGQFEDVRILFDKYNKEWGGFPLKAAIKAILMDEEYLNLSTEEKAVFALFIASVAR